MADVEVRDTGMALSVNGSISEYAWRTEERMQLDTRRVLEAEQAVTEEMAVTQVKAVMVDLEEKFEFLLPKPTLISFGFVTEVPSIILAEEEVQQGAQG